MGMTARAGGQPRQVNWVKDIGRTAQAQCLNALEHTWSHRDEWIGFVL
jgi:hypothetical protein